MRAVARGLEVGASSSTSTTSPATPLLLPTRSTPPRSASSRSPPAPRPRCAPRASTSPSTRATSPTFHALPRRRAPPGAPRGPATTTCAGARSSAARRALGAPRRRAAPTARPRLRTWHGAPSTAAAGLGGCAKAEASGSGAGSHRRPSRRHLDLGDGVTVGDGTRFDIAGDGATSIGAGTALGRRCSSPHASR